MKWPIVLGVLIGAALSEIDTQGSKTLQEIGSSLNISAFNISTADISGLNLPVNMSQVPTLEDAERVLQERCKKNGGDGAYQRVVAAKDEAQTCVMSLVNVTELQEEVEQAKPTGDLDIVFKKYCRKSPILLECISNFTSALDPCLEEEEKASKRLIQNVTTSLLNFICYSEGDRIALFIAEGGPECLQSKKEAIESCVNQTARSYINTNVPLTMATLPRMVLDEKECEDMKKTQQCVVRVLEGCDEPTPSNIIGSLFDYVWQMTPCNKMILADQQARTGVSAASGAPILVPAAALALPALLGAVVGRRLH